MDLDSGSILGRYRIDARLGAGGMGVVYRAFDTRLERAVALKLLPAGVIDEKDRERFVQEAKAASGLNHPNIVTVFDIDRVGTGEGEVDVLAMELVDGETLDHRLAEEPVGVREALDLAIELADALAAAHRAGIVHRDVKPGNLMLTGSGRFKLLDFGLARILPAAPADPAAATAVDLTATGYAVGTPAYMAPEQLTGGPVDARSDVFAAGLVLYEMLVGRRPFGTSTPLEIALSAAAAPVPSLRQERPEIPPELDEIVRRCLARSPADRFPSGVELHDELVALRDGLSAPAGEMLVRLRRPAVAVPVILGVVVLLGVAAWFGLRAAERRQARAELVHLEGLVEQRRFMEAYRLAAELRPILGSDRELERLVLASTLPVTVRSTPPGAHVRFRTYLDDPAVWEPLGTTPLERLRLPAKPPFVFQLEKAGFQPVEAAPPCEHSPEAIVCDLEMVAEGTAPHGMVRVPGGGGTAREGSVPLEAFWLGRYEVTNRQYREFVDAGGYRNPAYWTEPFLRDGETLSWEEAIPELVDATGRPGPATWRLGNSPDGQDDHPVAGVSWYEAAAFARWAGAELPTLHHWLSAAEFGTFSEILQRSNFDGDGTMPVGSVPGVGPYGTYDMAGNVFEWTWNGDGAGQRYIVGGAWNEPSYTYVEPGPVPPFDRGPNRGFRLARYEQEPSEEARRAIPVRPPPQLGAEPVGDELFAAYRGFYTYDETELNASVDGVDDSVRHYRWERVSYDAVYGGERIAAHLLLPRNARPPYQVVVWFPPSPAENLASSQELHGLPWFEFLVRSGRAVLFPVYKNTYERRIPDWEWTPKGRRDVMLMWSKDLGRSIDYLETRPDIDQRRVGFFGLSLGAVYGPVVVAVEPRIRAAIFLGGGLNPGELPPEIDPVNFAPRVRAPTLMLTGRDDFVRPVPTHQEPLFRLLGLPEDQKRLAQLEGGHLPSDMNAAIRESLAWLDRWLGPVEESSAADR